MSLFYSKISTNMKSLNVFWFPGMVKFWLHQSYYRELFWTPSGWGIWSKTVPWKKFFSLNHHKEKGRTPKNNPNYWKNEKNSRICCIKKPPQCYSRNERQQLIYSKQSIKPKTLEQSNWMNSRNKVTEHQEWTNFVT